MDSITQAALGAAIGHVMLSKRIGGKAAILGAVIGIRNPYFGDKMMKCRSVKETLNF